MELNELDQWWLELGLEEGSYRGTLNVFLLVLATALLAWLFSVIFRRLERQALKTRNLWDDSLIDAARLPLVMLVWLLGISLAAHVADRYAEIAVFGWVAPLRRIGVIVLLCWFVVRFIRDAEKILVSPERLREPLDPTTVSAMGKLLRLSVIITTLLVILQSLGYSISGVLAFGGIGGIAVGFAAKDLLANFFGGLMVYLDRPFSVGDWIRSPDKEIEGTVEHIGWRLTTIRTFDKRPLYVPNSVFTSIAVQNPSRMSHRRIYETFGLRYDDAAQIATVVEQVKQMLLSHEDLDTSQTLIVNFNAFNESSLDFFVYTFTRTTNWIEYHRVKQDVLLKILSIIENAGAEVAFPTRTLHVPEIAGMALESREVSAQAAP